MLFAWYSPYVIIFSQGHLVHPLPEGKRLIWNLPETKQLYFWNIKLSILYSGRKVEARDKFIIQTYHVLSTTAHHVPGFKAVSFCEACEST